jgi:L-rhamnose 1-dehydrogenase
VDLTGKVALVTGASRGIGNAIARRLAQAGAAVAVNYHETVPDALIAEIAASGGRAIAVKADVASKSEVDAMVEQVVAAFGGLDILVNNAGICPFHDFLDMPEELWDRVQDVNLKGAFLCSQAAARQMMAQGRGGRIIAISSIGALVGGGQQTHYNPTKSGMHSLMQSLAIALGPHGITCNSVLPGTITTDINREDLSNLEKRAYMERRIPIGRLGAPEDIAGPVAFLATEEARYVNGAALLVDGGLFVNLQ